ncbi:MAG TPA: hypothetical protein VEX86_21560 [Longimicrobium sp.]|nr:hypothetical protein [Longimicrobium sp.]
MTNATKPETAARVTLARGYVPGPAIRRVWPAAVCAFGLKRTLTGISFENAEKRMHAHPSLAASLSAGQIAAIKAYDGPEIVGRGGPKRNDLRVD